MIYITPTDKSGGFAIYDREEYIKNMNCILNKKFIDEHGNTRVTYEEINMNGVEKFFREICSTLEDGYKQGFLSEYELKV